VCRKPRRLCLGGDILIGVRKQARGAIRGAYDLGFRSRVEFLEHRFLVDRILLADASNSCLIFPVFATLKLGAHTKVPPLNLTAFLYERMKHLEFAVR
jgi:hypothetical protein